VPTNHPIERYVCWIKLSRALVRPASTRLAAVIEKHIAAGFVTERPGGCHNSSSSGVVMLEGRTVGDGVARLDGDDGGFGDAR
jgi:hypothetical protein